MPLNDEEFKVFHNVAHTAIEAQTLSVEEVPDWKAVRQIGLGCLIGFFVDVNTYAVLIILCSMFLSYVCNIFCLGNKFCLVIRSLTCSR